jgi:Flp pilus assembly protein TadG
MLRKVPRRRGGAAVELAILLPFLVFLFAITIDWTRIIYYTLTINNCARNGALWLSDPYSPIGSPYSTLTQAALADATNINPQPTVSPATGSTGVDANGYAYAECSVSYVFKTITNVPGVPQNSTISRTVRVYTIPQAPK